MCIVLRILTHVWIHVITTPHHDAGHIPLSPEKNFLVQKCINVKTILKEVISVSCDIHCHEILRSSQMTA